MVWIWLAAALLGIGTALTPPTCDPAVVSFVSDPTSCTQYYTCYNGVATLQTCPDQKYFDATRMLCDVPEYVNCVVDPCAATTGVTSLPIANSCTAYTLCVEGTGYQVTCASGTLYDETYGDCVLAGASSCVENPCLSLDPATATPTTFYPVSNSCTKYIICNKQEAVVRECVGSNVFNRVEAKCVPKASYTCPAGTA
ncbi:peritrophin-44-like [Anopheles bellator]|uniref:peritrophin-44-like n=1 Tax=Anopheles bellator TaxID=139047 RepID=UPI002649550B|nr:peritrophin-44-like [Anopheles bellator]